jgi:tryptophan-rich sensory protein
MKFKPNYLVIPMVTIAVALLGSFFTSNGMAWYNAEIIRPSLTPPKIAFPIAWNTIFVLTTISALMVWNKGKKDKSKKVIFGLFILNAFLNVFWSLLFFQMRQIELAFIEMILLEATIIALMILIWKRSKIASALLIPYASWLILATYLTYNILILN